MAIFSYKKSKSIHYQEAVSELDQQGNNVFDVRFKRIKTVPALEAFKYF